MQLMLENNACTGCSACMNICPKNAIKMDIKNGFYYPKIDEQSCIRCGKCKKICPLYENDIEDEKELVGYAAKNEDTIREKCSSGGVFAKIAEYILENDGYVCGAAYDSEFNVYHKIVKEKNELYPLLGSKYVQSKIGYVFREIRELLEEDRVVLFSGTPCQTHGLKQYLGKEYKNLICIDVVCHGVPSPIMWKKYLKELMDQENLVEVRMRDKSSGWIRCDYSYSFFYKDGSAKYIHNKKVPYHTCFAGDIALRESCYNCKYRKVFHSQTDIVTGDFWDIEKLYPEFCDEKGISITYACSQKGGELLGRVNLSLNKVDLQSVLERNPRALKNPVASRHRLKPYFMKVLLNSTFSNAYKKIRVALFLTKISDRMIGKLKRVRK